MLVLRAVHATLAFAIEMYMLWVYGLWAWHSAEALWSRGLLVVLVLGVAIALWAKWAAPKAVTRLPPPWLWCFEWAMFACAALALYGLGRGRAAAWYLAISTLSLVGSAYLAAQRA